MVFTYNANNHFSNVFRNESSFCFPVQQSTIKRLVFPNFLRLFHLATSAFPIGKDLRKVRVFFQNWKKQLFLTNLGYV